MNSLPLTQQSCHGREIHRLGSSELPALLAQLKEWQLNNAQNGIEKTLNFKDYAQTTAFVNAVVWLAQREDHHPDISFGYNRCHIALGTHQVGGLSIKDFILAAHIDQLLLPTS